MFSRENSTGVLLLIFCGVVALILVRAIVTGETPTVPSALRVPFTILGIALAGLFLWRHLTARRR